MACHLRPLRSVRMKNRERDEARRLRRCDGLSLQEIARTVGVSKSSVSLWVRDIELTPEQHRRLNDSNCMYGAQVRSRAVRMATFRRRRAEAQEGGRATARERDPFHAAGCMLYWAEGSKKRNLAQLSNADPEVVRFFVRFIRTYFDVPDEAFRVTCHLFADHLPQQERIEQFWLDQLDLPRASLCKSIVNVYSKYSLKKRANRLPYGTCRVTVHRTSVVQHIYGAIQEYAGFDRPEWLD
jgi:AcrR family transcriptional regulator